mmetsp:Transcript_17094/g.37059  ORF Transcript_17094/g.37059 Transcript_17094/m.37059 type:complete len:132 (-) Transcript_17094:1055-1450(-)
MRCGVRCGVRWCGGQFGGCGCGEQCAVRCARGFAMCVQCGERHVRCVRVPQPVLYCVAWERCAVDCPLSSDCYRGVPRPPVASLAARHPEQSSSPADPSLVVWPHTALPPPTTRLETALGWPSRNVHGTAV